MSSDTRALDPRPTPTTSSTGLLAGPSGFSSFSDQYDGLPRPSRTLDLFSSHIDGLGNALCRVGFDGLGTPSYGVSLRRAWNPIVRSEFATGWGSPSYGEGGWHDFGWRVRKVSAAC
ncbi:hypothetical protein RB7601 [Rhodopirellula baltica SH 1]|uniref:Uncharacterized protein n=1 Tax=Rhodopirellula baltica (strain DSM 10527 / NCIMB 13988 / SH1) TaxID=243090 RepID=Q7UNF8_RHOBA|nr:hypothetical protein RB7601 [Rhodopirellula baltica SH 1]